MINDWSVTKFSHKSSELRYIVHVVHQNEINFPSFHIEQPWSFIKMCTGKNEFTPKSTDQNVVSIQAVQYIIHPTKL